jgi:hypothetical protein
MAKRKRVDIAMAKSKRVDNAMAKRKRVDNPMHSTWRNASYREIRVVSDYIYHTCIRIFAQPE